jgi:hypothetical protein
MTENIFDSTLNGKRLSFHVLKFFEEMSYVQDILYQGKYVTT